MAPRLERSDPTLSNEQNDIARNAQHVLFDEASSGGAFKTACERFITFTAIEGCPAIGNADFKRMVLRAATFAADCDEAIWQDLDISMAMMASLWMDLLANGLTFDKALTPPELLAKIDGAAAKIQDPARRVINRQSLVATHPHPPGVPQWGGVAGAAAPDPITNLLAPTLLAMTYHDVYGDERLGKHVAALEFAVGTRLLSTQRAANSPYHAAWLSIARAVNNGRDSISSLIVRADAEERAVTIGRAMRAAEWPGIYATWPMRPIDRRLDIGEGIRRQGEPDSTFVRERLPVAVCSGQLPLVKRLLEGAPFAAAMKTLVASACAVLEITDASGGENSLRELEAALGPHRGAIGRASDPRARIELIKSEAASKVLAVGAAPKHDAIGGGVYGPLPSHAKAQATALYDIYATANFSQQAEAIEAMTDPCGYLYLALTAEFLSDVEGSAAGPRNKAEAEKAEAWTPEPIFHQLVWGKVETLLGKPELNKIAHARIHLPILLGKLAVTDVQGVDKDGKQRFAGLKLTELAAALAKPTWKGLDLVNDMDIPIMAAFHDVPLADIAAFPKEELYRDVFQLMRIRAPLAKVFKLVGVCNSHGLGSVRGMLAPAENMVMLHGPGASPEQLVIIGTAVRTYVIDTLEEYVVAYGQARGKADATAKFTAELAVGGNALTQFNQTLRALNSGAARKRGLEGTQSQGWATITIPRLEHTPPAAALFCRGAPSQYGPLSQSSLAGTMPPPHSPAGSVAAARATSPTHSMASISSASALARPPAASDQQCKIGKFTYNKTQTTGYLKSIGCAHLCVEALLCSGATNPATRERLEKKACTQYGSKGHDFGGYRHTIPAGKTFDPATFRI